MTRRATLWLVGCVAAAVSAGADVIVLKNGFRVEGRVVSIGPERVVVKIPYGTYTLPYAQVKQILRRRTQLEVYEQRLLGLGRRDAAGLARLARWALANRLVAQARRLYERVRQIDPDHPEARRVLGRAQAFRIAGYVRFRGSWVSPGMRTRILLLEQRTERLHAELAAGRTALARVAAEKRELENRVSTLDGRIKALERRLEERPRYLLRYVKLPAGVLQPPVVCTSKKK